MRKYRIKVDFGSDFVIEAMDREAVENFFNNLKVWANISNIECLGEDCKDVPMVTINEGVV